MINEAMASLELALAQWIVTKGLGFRLLNMHMHVCIHKVKSLLIECAILNAYPAKIVWTPLNLLCIPYSGKLLREKTFPNFAVWRHGILWYSKK